MPNLDDSVPTLEEYNWISGKDGIELPLESPASLVSRGRTSSWFTEGDVVTNKEGPNRSPDRRVQHRVVDDSQQTFVFKEFKGYNRTPHRRQNDSPSLTEFRAKEQKEGKAWLQERGSPEYTQDLERKQDEHARKVMMSSKVAKESWASTNSVRKGGRKKPPALALESSAYEFTDTGGNVVGAGVGGSVPSMTVTNGEKFVWRGGSAATKVRAKPSINCAQNSYLPGLLNSKSLQDRLQGHGHDWVEPWAPVVKTRQFLGTPTATSFDKVESKNEGGRDKKKSISLSNSPEKMSDNKGMGNTQISLIKSPKFQTLDRPGDDSWGGLYNREFGDSEKRVAMDPISPKWESTQHEGFNVNAPSLHFGSHTHVPPSVTTELPSPLNEGMKASSCRHHPSPSPLNKESVKSSGGRPVSRRSSRATSSKSSDGQRSQRKRPSRPRRGQEHLMAFNL